MTAHGRGRYWEEFTVGEVLITGRRTVDGGDVSRFAGLTGDFNPLHVDAEFARTTPFGERVAQKVREAKPSSKADRGVVVFDVAVKNQRGEAVCTYETAVLMRRRR